MKAIYLLCLFFLSVNAVINQEAQRREAPAFPQKEYGPPRQPIGPAGVDQRHRRIQAMQRLIAAMRNGGYSAQGQGRVVNRPKPIPVQNTYGPPQPPIPPQNTYGPPAGGYSSSSGSLAAFTNNQTPGVSCEGWIPIPGPSISSGSGSASSGGHIDTSYGPPNHSSGGALSTVIVVPEDTSIITGSSASGAGHHSIDTSYGVPPPPVNPQSSYGPPNSFSGGHSSSSGSLSSIDTSYGAPAPPVIPIAPQNTYGAPATYSSHGSASSGHSFQSIDTSFGVPPPPVNPQKTYGVPKESASGHSSSGHSSSGHSYSGHSSSGHSSSGHSSVGSIDITYGVPEPRQPPQNTYGLPSAGGVSGPIQTPDSSYGPPIIVGSGHASSASALAAIDNSYGVPPQPAPVVENSYLPPQEHASGHSSSGNSFGQVDNSYSGPAPVGHLTYGPPQQPQDFGPPESSYGPPPSGAVDFKHSSAGNVGSIEHIPSLPTDIQLPIANSGSNFDNAIGLVSSTLGVSTGNSEVVQSHAIHESHTSEVAHSHSNVNSFSSASGSSASGDTYSAPPLDSYAPGKYAPSFLNRRPAAPPQPVRPIAPQRPPLRQPIAPPRPQYVPPIPTKSVRPQLPPPSFRPLTQGGGHAQSVAHGYSSQSHHSHQQHQQQQTVYQAPPRPIRPLIHRQPVPQGLIQSIGQNVQAQDSHRGLSSGNTYLPPPTNEVPIPPMRLVLPNPGAAHNFHSQQSAGGVATSSSSFSLQNQDLRQVQIIHDCGKGPQLSQSYGTPLAPPLTSYGTPNAGESHSAVLSTSYEIPSQELEVPQHHSINFNTPSNSYGPPASGPASLDVIGLESRANLAVAELQPAESKDTPQAELPGLSSGLSGSGLDFISAIKSHSIEVPQNQAASNNIQFHIQTSQSGQNDNRIDGANHQQILADGLLQSILTAIEKQPGQNVPQVTEDVEHDHSEAKTFLKSREGQEVLADKTAGVDAKKN